MKRLKRHFKYFLPFSLFLLVLCATSSADPGQSVFPPLPPDQEMPGEDVSGRIRPPKPPKPPTDSDSIIHYRGTRTYAEDLPLEINHVRCERKADDVVSVVIIFNQSINPRSLHHDSLFINNAPLPFGTRFSFGKKGDKIKLMVPSKNNSFKLKIQNISSFNGSVIEPIEVLAEVKG